VGLGQHLPAGPQRNNLAQVLVWGHVERNNGLEMPAPETQASLYATGLTRAASLMPLAYVQLKP
jgi:hypothetical protein